MCGRFEAPVGFCVKIMKPQVVSRFLELVASQTVFLINSIVVAEVYAGAFAREYKDDSVKWVFVNWRQTLDENGVRTEGTLLMLYVDSHPGYCDGQKCQAS